MRKAGVAKTKARPTSFFSHKTWKLPSSIPSPTESKITAVYIHLSSTQRFLIRLLLGCTNRRSHHPPPCFIPTERRPPPGIHV